MEEFFMKKANYTIREIEDLTEAQAAAMATESEIIKEHQIYFIDFGGYFGYSALVFADGQQILSLIHISEPTRP